MGRVFRIGLLDIVLSLSEAMDLVSPLVVGHHKRVACVSLALAKALKLPQQDQTDILLAASLHDSGAFSLKTRLDSLEFEMVNPHEHAEMGYRLLQMFEPFSRIASLVRSHHVPWEDGRGEEFLGEPVPLGSHVIHLADRLSVLIENPEGILEQRDSICDVILRGSGTKFAPVVVEALKGLADLEYFWLDSVSPEIDSILVSNSNLGNLVLTTEELKGLVRLFYHIIDFRSCFTATHTSGVHACARTLARHCDLSAEECDRMGMAACLHDLGKLSVPREILEKTSTLTQPEQIVMRGHPYYGFRILEKIPELSEINAWANYHHERLDGSGYPFHIRGEDLSLGSRIMSVADVFTATTEERPYRKGMTGREALSVMGSMANHGKLDPEIVAKATRVFEELDAVRSSAQREAADSYRSLCRGLQC